MGTGKYPEEIVEKVAKAIFVWDTSEGISGPQWARLSTEQRDVWREAALVALDALGLTVTEEWGAQSRHHTFERPSAEIAAGMLRAEERVVRRTVLHAETPWEVVDQ